MPSGIPVIPDLNYGSTTLDLLAVLRKQISYDGDDRQEYIGFTMYPGDVSDQPVWMIYKLLYDGSSENITDQLIPLQGIGFKYNWDDRATLF